MIYKILLIIVFVIFIFYFFNLNLDEKENFRSLSQYSKQFIVADTISNLNQSGYLLEEETDSYNELEDAAEKSAFVSNPPFKDYLCNEEDMQVIEVNDKNTSNGFPKSRLSVDRYIGCAKNSSNVLGLNWDIPKKAKDVADKMIKRNVKIEIFVKSNKWSNSSQLKGIYLYGSGEYLGIFKSFDPQPMETNKKYTYNFEIETKPNKTIDKVLVIVGNDWLNADIKVFVQNLSKTFELISEMSVSQKNNSKWYSTLFNFPLINRISIQNINPSIMGNSLVMGAWQFYTGGINCDGSNFNQTQKNNNVGNWDSLGMTSNINFSISFWYYIPNSFSKWRSILRVTKNNSTDCCNEYQRQPALFVAPNKADFAVCRGIEGNGNWWKWGYATLNTMNHFTISFNKKGFNIYKNGVLISNNVHSANSLETFSGSSVYIGDSWYDTDGVKLKNIVFWNSSLGDLDAKLLYEKYIPIVKSENTIKLKGKDENSSLSDEEKFNIPFTIKRGFFLGYYGSLDLNDSLDMKITFDIKMTNNFNNWRNIFHICNNNTFAGGVKGKFWGPRNGSKSGPGCNNYSRCPGIWVWPNEPKLHICRSTNTNWNFTVDTGKLTLNEWISITIIFNSKTKNISVSYNYTENYTVREKRQREIYGFYIPFDYYYVNVTKTREINETKSGTAPSTFIPILDDASVWLADSIHPANDGVQIRNFVLSTNI